MAEGTDWLTVDAFAKQHGITVRTLRYYASLGLIPAPERRGRSAYYGPAHGAHLDLVFQLQQRGMSMAGIAKAVAPIASDASEEDLTVHQAMLSTWTLAVNEPLTRTALDQRAGRALSDAELEVMIESGVLVPGDGTYAPLDGFDIALELIDLGVDRSVIIEAGQTIERHMRAVARDLNGIMRDLVIEPYRSQTRTPEEAEHLGRVIGRLRALTTSALVSGFHRVTDPRDF